MPRSKPQNKPLITSNLKLLLPSKILAISACALLAASAPALAHVTSGANCSQAGCHTNIVTGAIALSGNLAVPTSLSVNPRNDGGYTGSLPSFTVYPGGMITLQLDVTPLGDNFFGWAITGSALSGNASVSLISNSINGTITGNGTVAAINTPTPVDLLSYTPGTNTGWVYTLKPGPSRPGNYYNTAATVWASGVQTNYFSMTIDANTPADVYTMTYRASGGTDTTTTIPKWTQSQEFLINVIPEPGPLAMIALSGVALLISRRRRR